MTLKEKMTQGPVFGVVCYTGAEGVIVSHCKTKEDIEKIIESSKFPPIGRRGEEACACAARF